MVVALQDWAPLLDCNEDPGLTAVTSVGGGSGITATPNPIITAGTLALGPLTSDWAAGGYRISSLNSVNVRNAASYATGGAGTAVSPWTSASGTGGIQEAYNALTTPFGAVYMPAGYYSITSVINMTDNSGTQFDNYGASMVHPITVYGDGAGTTILVAGTNGIVFDMTGSGGYILRDFAILPAVATPSTVGILQARSTVSVASSDSRIENVYIDLKTIPAANGGAGTVGIYNHEAEQNLYINNHVVADNPLVITSQNVFSISSPSVPMGTINFAQDNTIIGGMYQTVGAGAAITLQGCVNMTRSNASVLFKAGASTATHGIKILADSVTPTTPIRDLDFTNTFYEAFDRAISTTAPLRGFKTGGYIGQNTGASILLSGTNASIFGGEINLVPAAAAPAEPLIGDGGVASGGVAMSSIRLYSGQSISCALSPGAGNKYFSEVNAPTITFSGNGDAGQIVLSPGATQLGGKDAHAFVGISGPGTESLDVTPPTDGVRGLGVHYTATTYQNIRAGIRHGGNAAGLLSLGGAQWFAQGASQSTVGSGAHHFLTPTGDSVDGITDATLADRLVITQPGKIYTNLGTASNNVAQVGGTVFTQTADKVTTANNLTSLFSTGVGSLTLPANVLIAGRTIEIRMGGFVSAADGGAGTKTLTLTLGGVTVATGASGATFTTVLNSGWEAFATITCRTTGAGGTVIGGGRWQGQIATATPVAVMAVATAAAACNTTGTLAVDLLFNNGNAVGTITTTYAEVKIVG